MLQYFCLELKMKCGQQFTDDYQEIFHRLIPLNHETKCDVVSIVPERLFKLYLRQSLFKSDVQDKCGSEHSPTTTRQEN